MRILAGMLLGVVLLTILGCATESPRKPEQTIQPSDCSTEEPPSELPNAGDRLRLVVTKEVVQPGEEVAITIDGDPSIKTTRGVDAYLECWTGTDWATKFVMILNTDGGANKPTVRPYPMPVNSAIISLGLLGPGPEPVKLPDEIQPGWYRIRKHITVDGPQYDPKTLYVRLKVVRK